MTGARLEKKAKDAEALIRFFEDQGRQVVGVTLGGNGVRLEFATEQVERVNAADLVRMDQ